MSARFQLQFSFILAARLCNQLAHATDTTISSSGRGHDGYVPAFLVAAQGHEAAANVDRSRTLGGERVSSATILGHAAALATMPDAHQVMASPSSPVSAPMVQQMVKLASRIPASPPRATEVAAPGKAISPPTVVHQMAAAKLEDRSAAPTLQSMAALVAKMDAPMSGNSGVKSPAPALPATDIAAGAGASRLRRTASAPHAQPQHAVFHKIVSIASSSAPISEQNQSTRGVHIAPENMTEFKKVSSNASRPEAELDPVAKFLLDNDEFQLDLPFEGNLSSTATHELGEPEMGEVKHDVDMPDLFQEQPLDNSTGAMEDFLNVTENVTLALKAIANVSRISDHEFSLGNTSATTGDEAPQQPKSKQRRRQAKLRAETKVLKAPKAVKHHGVLAIIMIAVVTLFCALSNMPKASPRVEEWRRFLMLAGEECDQVEVARQRAAAFKGGAKPKPRTLPGLDDNLEASITSKSPGLSAPGADLGVQMAALGPSALGTSEFSVKLPHSRDKAWSADVSGATGVPMFNSSLRRRSGGGQSVDIAALGVEGTPLASGNSDLDVAGLGGVLFGRIEAENGEPGSYVVRASDGRAVLTFRAAAEDGTQPKLILMLPGKSNWLATADPSSGHLKMSVKVGADVGVLLACALTVLLFGLPDGTFRGIIKPVEP